MNISENWGDLELDNVLEFKGDKQYERLDTLIHKVFSQTEEGRELLSIWKECLIMQAVAQPGADIVTIGIEEGKRTFIRRIIQTIQKVENRV